MMRFIKAVCHSGGHSWKDNNKVGRVAFAYSRQLPPPYQKGQFPIVGCPIACVTAEHFTLTKASIFECLKILPVAIKDWRSGLVQSRWVRAK